MKLKSILSITLLITLIALAVYYIINHISDFKQLSIVNPWLILVLILFSLIGIISNGLITKYLLQPFKINIHFKEWFGLTVITSLGNYITPFRGGAVTRAIYLKKKYNFSYEKFLATLSAIYVLIFLAASFVGLISMLALYLQYGMFNLLIFLIFLAFFIPLAIIVIFSPKVPETKGKFLNKFINIINGWHEIKSNRKIVFVVTLFSLISLILGAIGIMLTYSIFGIEVSFSKALFLTAIGVLGSLAAITPGGLGISEAVSVFSSLLVGITASQALTAAIIGRAIGIIVIFTLGPCYSYILMRQFNKKSKN